jgi:hypothetical protein
VLYIAYTREDALFAVQLTRDLANLGIEVWLDINEIGPAADWSAAQTAAIEACEGLLIVLSPEAMKRDHMRTEIQQAFNRRKSVYLAVARRSPWRPWLNGLPLADFTDSYEAGLDTLVLNIMGDSRQDDATVSDAADIWLREAGATDQTDEPEPATEKKPRRSIIGRLLRRD